MTSKTFCVYCHTSPSGKKYIGITSRNPLKRWKNGIGYKGNDYFYRAIQKYGWKSFIHEILYEGLDSEEASAIERKLIAEFDTTNQDKGYNISNGGFGGSHPITEETKIKIGNANRGRKCPEHQKRYLSELNKGKIPTNLDNVHKRNMKPVSRYDLDGNYIDTFPSIRIAGQKCGIPESSIGFCCRGKYKTSGGYKWEFA